MENQALFVDFMYAVAVGAALPRLGPHDLVLDSPLAWGLLFLLSVFLEDFYLYHVKVLPHLGGRFPKGRSFILTMAIIGFWYLSQIAFPEKPRIFLISLIVFFLLKLLGGLFMKDTHYPQKHDYVFLLPVITAVVLFILLSLCGCLKSHPGYLLMALVPSWLLMVILWWVMDRSADQKVRDAA